MPINNPYFWLSGLREQPSICKDGFLYVDKQLHEGCSAERGEEVRVSDPKDGGMREFLNTPLEHCLKIALSYSSGYPTTSVTTYKYLSAYVRSK